MRILALDPGGTTGWALFHWDGIEEVRKNTKLFQCGQLGPNEHHKSLYSLLELEFTADPTIYVCERFEYRNASRAGLDLSSREYIGVLNLFAAERGISIVYQNASQAKGFVRDNHIKALGLWYIGNKHAMDAMRHLLYFIINNKNIIDMRYVANILLQEAWL